MIAAVDALEGGGRRGVGRDRLYRSALQAGLFEGHDQVITRTGRGGCVLNEVRAAREDRRGREADHDQYCQKGDAYASHGCVLPFVPSGVTHLRVFA